MVILHIGPSIQTEYWKTVSLFFVKIKQNLLNLLTLAAHAETFNQDCLVIISLTIIV